jgi:type I restriction enzyme S subunit
MAQVKLGDVALESRETYKGDKSGMPIVGLEHITPGEVTLSNWDTDTDNTFTKRFRKGDMLFGRRRAYLKKAAQAPFDGICSGDITVIRAKEDLLSPELLPFIIQNDNLFDFAVGKSAGSLSPRVKWDNLKNYTFELPSMEEQQKLAEVLWSINDTLQAYQNLLAETDALVQAKFVEMFGGITKNQRNWPVRTLGEIYNVTSSKRIYARELSTAGIPFLKVADVLEKIETGNSHPKTFITEQKFLELQKNDLVPNPGDILITSRGTIGKCYVVQAHDKFYFQDGMISWLRVKVENVLLSEFLSALFKTDDISNTIEKSALKTTVMYLSLDKLANLKVICPPINKQNEYLSFMQQNEKAKSTLQNTIASLQATKRCILDDALGTGRKE